MLEMFALRLSWDWMTTTRLREEEKSSFWILAIITILFRPERSGITWQRALRPIFKKSNQT